MATICNTKLGFCSDAADTIVDSIKSVTVDIDGIKQAGSDCYNSAREATTICDTTTSKTTEMISFGQEMKSALDGFTDGVDSSDFTAISRVVTGEKLTAALKTVTEMDDLALACVNRSLKMIDSIGAGVDSLPDVFEKKIDKRIEKAKDNGSNDDDPELLNLDTAYDELKQAVNSVVNVNPFTAIDSFKNAFGGVISKGNLCKDLFDTIHAFAKDVTGVSEAIQNFNLGKMVGKVVDLIKDIWRCLRLSDLIRSFAEAAGRLIKWIMKVIQALKEKIDSIDIVFDFDYSNNCGCFKEIESFKSFSQNILNLFTK